MFKKSSLLGLLAVLVASASPAQFVQYTPPGDFRSPAQAREDVFRQRMDDAAWRFGKLLVDPWIGIRQLGYEDAVVDASGEEVSDLSITMGAGLNAYLPVGSDWVWGAFILPEYSWWREVEERRRFNGRYGSGLFGNLGRLGLELSASRREEATVLSREIENRVNQRLDRAVVEGTVDIGKGVLLFVNSSEARVRSLEDELFPRDVSMLDRDETIHQGGVSFVFGRGVRAGVGYEVSEAIFTQSGSSFSGRSNSGDGVVFNLEYETPLLTLFADMARRSIEPEGPSQFSPFDGNTGELNLTWRLLGAVRAELFMRRDLAFSLQGDVSHLEDESLGAALRLSLGSSSSLRLLHEDGDVTFIPVTGVEDVRRLDRRTTWGLEMNGRLENIALTLRGTRTEYESTLPEFTREYSRISLSLGFGGDGVVPWR